MRHRGHPAHIVKGAVSRGTWVNTYFIDNVKMLSNVVNCPSNCRPTLWPNVIASRHRHHLRGSSMADTVQYLLEEQIPELEDYEAKGYFTKGELRQIIQKRQDFEYRLKRRAAMKQDYYR